MADFPNWRSMMFVPVHVPKFVDSAHSRAADAYVLDLEDSVPLSKKTRARSRITATLSKVTLSGASAASRGCSVHARGEAQGSPNRM